MACGIAEETRETGSGSEKAANNPTSGEAREGFDLGRMGHRCFGFKKGLHIPKNLDALVGIWRDSGSDRGGSLRQSYNDHCFKCLYVCLYSIVMYWTVLHYNSD